MAKLEVSGDARQISRMRKRKQRIQKKENVHGVKQALFFLCLTGLEQTEIPTLLDKYETTSTGIACSRCGELA